MTNTNMATRDSEFNVIVRLDISPEYANQFLATLDESAKTFKTQPGFISQDVYRSHDNKQVLTKFRWRSREDHEACMQNPVWRDKSCSKVFEQLSSQGKIAMTVGSFDHILSQ